MDGSLRALLASGTSAKDARADLFIGPSTRSIRVVTAAGGRPDASSGPRKPQGSPTDFNQQIREAVGEMLLTARAMTALRTGGASLLTQAGDGAKRVWLGRNNRTLAEILAAPDSVDRIGTILQRGTATPFADAALRQALQSRGVEAAGAR